MVSRGRDLLLIEAGFDGIAKLLEPTYRLTIVHDVSQAWEAIDKQTPEMILVALSVGQGLAPLQALRQDPRSRELPIFLLLDDPEPELRARALETGADDCLGAPFYPRELAARIERRVQSFQLRHSALLRSRRSEDRLKRQNETLISLAKERAANRTALEASLQQLVQAAAHTLSVDRASIWLYNEDRSGIECAALYERSPERYSSGARLLASVFPAYFQALETERIIAAENAFEDPRTSCFAESYLQPLGIGAMLDAPIRIHGRMVGVFCNEQVGPPRPWEMEEQNFTASLADLAALALEANERLLTERALRETEERWKLTLQAADRRKDDFLALLGHELRSPLSAISTAVQVLGMTANDPQRVQWAKGLIERQVQTLRRLVDDLSDVARITRGGLELRHQKVDLRTVLTRAIEATATFTESRQHKLNVDMPPTEVFAEADPTRLQQVVANLLNNAAKYTDPGGQLWLSLTREERSAVIRVHDNGIGIAPELLPHIWDLYKRGQHARVRGRDGLGIGLTLVRTLIELHGGSVEASSAGQGSEFVVRLPALDA